MLNFCIFIFRIAHGTLVLNFCIWCASGLGAGRNPSASLPQLLLCVSGLAYLNCVAPSCATSSSCVRLGWKPEREEPASASLRPQLLCASALGWKLEAGSHRDA